MFYYQHNDKQNSYTNTGKAFLFKQSGFFFILYDSDNIEEVVTDKKKKVEEERQKTRLSGFNSILAVQSIDFAKLYYNKLKDVLEIQILMKMLMLMLMNLNH